LTIYIDLVKKWWMIITFFFLIPPLMSIANDVRIKKWM